MIFYCDIFIPTKLYAYIYYCTISSVCQKQMETILLNIP